MEDGDFGENLIVSGIDVGQPCCGEDRLQAGDVVLESNPEGERSVTATAIFTKGRKMHYAHGGHLSRVVRGGTLRANDEIIRA